METEKKKVQRKIQKVSIEAVAVDDGYYKGQIIPTGKKFLFEGVTKDGKLPLWIKAAKKSAKKKVEIEEDEESDVSDLI